MIAVIAVIAVIGSLTTEDTEKHSAEPNSARGPSTSVILRVLYGKSDDGDDGDVARSRRSSALKALSRNDDLMLPRIDAIDASGAGRG